jgi:recombination protein RecA
MTKAPVRADLSDLVSSVRTALKDDLKVLKDVETWVPSEIPALDIALGGGLPVGRLTTIIGKKSAGKSTLGIHLMAQIQKMGGLAVGIDVERSNLLSRCKAQGLDIDRYLPSQPDSLDSYEMEDFMTGKKKHVAGAFEIMERVIKTIRKKDQNALVGIVLDSIAGSSVASEIGGEVGKATMGKHARICSQAFRKIMPIVHDMSVALIAVNQAKEAIGVMYGPKTTYIAKAALDFSSAITMELRQSGLYPNRTSPEGIITTAYISKNKVGNPFSTISWTTFFDRGIDTVFEKISFLEEKGIFGSSSGWLEWEGKKYRKGDFYQKVKDDSKLQAALDAEVDRFLPWKPSK